MLHHIESNEWVFIVIGIIIGVICGCVIVYIMRIYTSASEPICGMMKQKNNIYDTKMGGKQSREENVAPTQLTKFDNSNFIEPNMPEQPELAEEEPTALYAAHPKMPVPMKRDVGKPNLHSMMHDNTRLSTQPLPQPPKLPDVAKAQQLAKDTDSSAFLDTNKHLVDATNSNTLREKMNAARIGLSPINDRLELPFKTRVSDSAMYQTLIEKRSQQLKHHEHSLHFNMPQNYGMQQQQHPTLGQSLTLE